MNGTAAVWACVALAGILGLALMVIGLRLAKAIQRIAEHLEEPRDR